MKILLIDNYDSFTFNLYQQIERLGGRVDVRKHDEACEPDKYDAIVISPGPKAPRDAGISCDIIREFYGKKPILGVCLGHQCIGEVFGAKTIHAPQVMHGKTSDIEHTGKGLFAGAPEPFRVARYHSLIVDRVPDEFELTAWTRCQSASEAKHHNIIMAISHVSAPTFGVQFHPESFLTEGGDILIKNFFKYV